MADVATLILRLAVCGLLAGHGFQKLFGWFGGPGLKGTAGWLESIGLKPGHRWAPIAGLSEFGGASRQLRVRWHCGCIGIKVRMMVQSPGGAPCR